MPNLSEYSVAQLRKHISDHNKKYRVSNYWRVPKSKLISIIESGEHHLRKKLYRVKPALLKRKGKAVKGAKSKTHKGDLDYTTKKGDKDYHEGGHDVKKSKKPYSKSKKSVNGYFDALNKARKAKRPSFKWKGRTYVRTKNPAVYKRK